MAGGMPRKAAACRGCLHASLGEPRSGVGRSSSHSKPGRRWADANRGRGFSPSRWPGRTETGPSIDQPSRGSRCSAVPGAQVPDQSLARPSVRSNPVRATGFDGDRVVDPMPRPGTAESMTLRSMSRRSSTQGLAVAAWTPQMGFPDHHQTAAPMANPRTTSPRRTPQHALHLVADDVHDGRQSPGWRQACCPRGLCRPGVSAQPDPAGPLDNAISIGNQGCVMDSTSSAASNCAAVSVPLST